jgi:hypothetical protein
MCICMHGGMQERNFYWKGVQGLHCVPLVHGGTMHNEIYCNYIMINIYFRVCVKIFNR